MTLVEKVSDILYSKLYLEGDGITIREVAKAVIKACSGHELQQVGEVDRLLRVLAETEKARDEYLRMARLHGDALEAKAELVEDYKDWVKSLQYGLTQIEAECSRLRDKVDRLPEWLTLEHVPHV